MVNFVKPFYTPRATEVIRHAPVNALPNKHGVPALGVWANVGLGGGRKIIAYVWNAPLSFSCRHRYD